MPEFYQNLITEKSYKLLQNLKREFNFILIGGWAVFLYTGALKSKDIDMIVEYQELERLRKKFDLIKNERLKKYEVKQEEIDIDIYLPYYSNLGLPVEEIGNYAIVREGFKVPKIEVLLILKQFVFSQRQGSAKGEKDRLDILSLLKLREVDWDFYQELLSKYKLEGFKENLINLIKETKRVPELDLNEYKIAKLKEDLFNKLELFK
jgi:hypothetical protein